MPENGTTSCRIDTRLVRAHVPTNDIRCTSAHLLVGLIACILTILPKELLKASLLLKTAPTYYTDHVVSSSRRRARWRCWWHRSSASKTLSITALASCRINRALSKDACTASIARSRMNLKSSGARMVASTPPTNTIYSHSSVRRGGRGRARWHVAARLTARVGSQLFKLVPIDAGRPSCLAVFNARSCSPHETLAVQAIKAPRRIINAAGLSTAVPISMRRGRGGRRGRWRQ